MSYVYATHGNHLSVLSARSLLETNTFIMLGLHNTSGSMLTKKESESIYRCNRATMHKLQGAPLRDVVLPVCVAAVSADKSAPSGLGSGPVPALCRHAPT